MYELKEAYQSAKINLAESSIYDDPTISLTFSTLLKKYEKFIKFLEDASTSFHQSNSRIVKDAFHMETKRHFDDYKFELEKKLNFIIEDNKRLLEDISNLEKERENKRELQKQSCEAQKENHLKGKGCSGLTEMAFCKQSNIQPSQWGEKDFLKEKLRDLEKEKQTLEDSLKTRFVPKIKYAELFKLVRQKECQCEALSLINKTLKTKVKRLKVAIEAAEISAYHQYRSGSKTQQQLSTVVETVINSIATSKMENAKRNSIINSGSNDSIEISITSFDDVEDSLQGDQENELDPELTAKLQNIERPKSFEVKKSFTDDDPIKEQEAEMTMDYVETFSKLFSEHKYKEAAFHAIYSPKGVLRTQQTLTYFKNIDSTAKKGGEKKSRKYLLHYCTLLMSTINIVGKDPTVWEVIESFKCAINENRIDLIEYWIANEKVPLSEPIANLLLKSCICTPGSCRCKNVLLAELVFKQLSDHFKIVDIMLHQGKLATAVWYATEQAHLSEIDYARILEDETTCERLSQLISSAHKTPLIRRVIVALVSSGHEDKALTLIKACIPTHTIMFTFKDFVEWEGPPVLSEKFGSLCAYHELENIGIEFVSSCLIWYVIQLGNEVLLASY